MATIPLLLQAYPTFSLFPLFFFPFVQYNFRYKQITRPDRRWSFGFEGRPQAKSSFSLFCTANMSAG